MKTIIIPQQQPNTSNMPFSMCFRYTAVDTTESVSIYAETWAGINMLRNNLVSQVHFKPLEVLSMFLMLFGSGLNSSVFEAGSNWCVHEHFYFPIWHGIPLYMLSILYHKNTNYLLFFHLGLFPNFKSQNSFDHSLKTHKKCEPLHHMLLFCCHHLFVYFDISRQSFSV